MHREEEVEIDNLEYNFNEIAVNQLGDLDPQYAIDMKTIKEILLLEQQGDLANGFTNLLHSKRVKLRHSVSIIRMSMRGRKVPISSRRRLASLRTVHICGVR